MNIELIELAGLASTLNALRLPFGLEMRSSAVSTTTVDDNYLITSTTVKVDEKDMKLMETLVKRGDEHAKAIRGIIAYAKITAPIYWWCEMETYRAGHERLASNSTMHQDCRSLSGDELQQAKAAIPMGKELTKVDYFSYQCLRNIVRQRHDHRLREWHEFIDWVKTLPYADSLIFGLPMVNARIEAAPCVD